MSEHTPGPWTYDDRFTEVWTLDHKTVIALVAHPDLMAFDHLRTADDAGALANARLVAAAPTLLLACEAQANYEVHLEDCPQCSPASPCPSGEVLRDYAASVRRTACNWAHGLEMPA